MVPADGGRALADVPDPCSVIFSPPEENFNNNNNKKVINYHFQTIVHDDQGNVGNEHQVELEFIGASES